MRASVLVMLALVCTFAVAGCNKKTETKDGAAPGVGAAATAKSGGGIGLIDLDAVAKNLGRMGEMEKSQGEFQKAILEQLQLHVNEFNRQLADKKSIAGEKPTDEQEKAIAMFAGNLQGQFDSLKQQAGSKIQSHQVELVSKFKDEVKEPVREVAKSLGLSAVLYKNDASVFLVIDDAIDITDAVTEKMKASSAASSAKPAEVEKAESK